MKLGPLTRYDLTRFPVVSSESKQNEQPKIHSKRICQFVQAPWMLEEARSCQQSCSFGWSRPLTANQPSSEPLADARVCSLRRKIHWFKTENRRLIAQRDFGTCAKGCGYRSGWVHARSAACFGLPTLCRSTASRHGLLLIPLCKGRAGAPWDRLWVGCLAFKPHCCSNAVGLLSWARFEWFLTSCDAKGLILQTCSIVGLVAGSFSLISYHISRQIGLLCWHEESLSGGSMFCIKSCWVGLLGSGPQEQHPSEVLAVQVAIVWHGQMVMGPCRDSMGTYLPRCQHYGAEHVWSVNAFNPNQLFVCFFATIFVGMFFFGGCASIYSVGVSFCLYASSWPLETGHGFNQPNASKIESIPTSNARASRTFASWQSLCFGKESNKKKICVWASMVYSMGRFPNFAHAYSNSCSWHFCAFRHGKNTLIN